MTSPHERLDAAMDERRLDLNMTWQDVAQEASVSAAALRAMRTGVNTPSPLTRRRLEDALRWQRGSIEAILEGGSPTPIDVGHAADADEITDARLDRLEGLLAEATRIAEEIRGERRQGGGRR